MKFRAWAAVMAVVLVACGGCAGGVGREPVNLTTRKAEIVRYQESGDYARGMAAVAAEASRWIEARAAKRVEGERLAVVFDIDETVLSNWENMKRDDFSYISERWHAWVDRAEGTAIEPVRETFQVARRAGVAVIFLTGRKERDRAGTERNLRAEGLGDYAELIVRAESGAAEAGAESERGRSAVVFKTAVRKRLTEAGWKIIANVGDQESDLAGGYAEKVFKLPNPFYLTE
ncbi:HAD family acid phosphatase [Nibricoccus aquaticus]|nr:HAD family acid phosphatase [Nibricoccus aquaticus]